MEEKVNQIIDLLNNADMAIKDEIKSASSSKNWVTLLIAARQHLQNSITDALRALKAKETQEG